MQRHFYKLFLVSAFFISFSTVSFAQAKKKNVGKKAVAISTKKTEPNAAILEPWKQLDTKERLLEITTPYGTMIAKLYDSTPLHRDNFVKLVQQKFYDSLLFHRIIDGFMIQGGDPTSKNAPIEAQLGSGSAPGERIPAEFRPYFIHKKGALAAARDMNPEKASSNCQFYIVQGKPIAEQDFSTGIEKQVKNSNPSFSYTKAQKETYSRLGGTAFLDQSYTVFGEVISGLDVIDKIAKAPKQPGDRPNTNIPMKIRLLN